MKKLLLLILIGFYSCKSQDYLSTEKCIYKKNQFIINKGVNYFETKLAERYPNLTKEAAYFKFISDWSSKKLNTDFFSDKSLDSIHKQIRNIEIWEESIRSSENMEREAKLYNVSTMNPKRIKLDKETSICLAKASNTDGIIHFLILINSDHILIPRLAQKKLFHSSESDLKNDENRIAIALGVYYQTAFNIN